MTNNTDSVNSGAVLYFDRATTTSRNRRHFVGGSDARIIMGKDQKALLRLWREKRGEEPSLDLSGVLVAQLGCPSTSRHRNPEDQEPTVGGRRQTS